MKDLHEILREKEQAIQRLEKEIEAIRVVLGILQDEGQSTTTVRTAEDRVPAPPVSSPAERPMYAAAVPNNAPPIPAPFSVSSGAQAQSGTPMIDARKRTSLNWP